MILKDKTLNYKLYQNLFKQIKFNWWHNKVIKILNKVKKVKILKVIQNDLYSIHLLKYKSKLKQFH